MNTEEILKALEAERNAIDNAIAALKGSRSTRRSGRRKMSAAARKLISIAQKKRWAARKKG